MKKASKMQPEAKCGRPPSAAAAFRVRRPLRGLFLWMLVFSLDFCRNSSNCSAGGLKFHGALVFLALGTAPQALQSLQNILKSHTNIAMENIHFQRISAFFWPLLPSPGPPRLPPPPHCSCLKHTLASSGLRVSCGFSVLRNCLPHGICCTPSRFDA